MSEFNGLRKCIQYSPLESARYGSQYIIVIGLSGVQSGSNRVSNFKSAERVARGRFEITSVITPELYDTKFNY